LPEPLYLPLPLLCAVILIAAKDSASSSLRAFMFGANAPGRLKTAYIFIL
jgi:hypothetical protein